MLQRRGGSRFLQGGMEEWQDSILKLVVKEVGLAIEPFIQLPIVRWVISIHDGSAYEDSSVLVRGL